MEHNWFHLGKQGRLPSRMIPEDGQEPSLQPSLFRGIQARRSPVPLSASKGQISTPPPPAGALLSLPTWIPEGKAGGCSLLAAPSPHLCALTSLGPGPPQENQPTRAKLPSSALYWVATPRSPGQLATWCPGDPQSSHPFPACPLPLLFSDLLRPVYSHPTPKSCSLLLQTMPK